MCFAHCCDFHVNILEIGNIINEFKRLDMFRNQEMITNEFEANTLLHGSYIGILQLFGKARFEVGFFFFITKSRRWIEPKIAREEIVESTREKLSHGIARERGGKK